MSSNQAQQHRQQQNQPTSQTTNLTLNMNFNLQQSTIQVQPSHPQQPHTLPRPPRRKGGHSDQNVSQPRFASPRSQQNPLDTSGPQHLTPQQHNASYHGAFKSPDVTSLKSQSPKTYKLAQIRGRGGASDKQPESIGAQSSGVSPPNLPTGKVKKIKVNKLNAEQLNQIRANQEQSMVGSASQLQNTGLLGLGQLRTDSEGPDSQYEVHLKQQQHLEMVAQQLHYQQMHNVGGHHTVQPLSDSAQISQQTQKYSASNMSARQSRNYISATQSPGLHSRQQLGESDSKLGRKGERPTVAQILETDRAVPQQLSRMTLNSVPNYNATVTSNFDSLGRNSLQVPNSESNTHPLKQPKQVKGQSMDDARSPHMKGANQTPQDQLSQPQFRRMRKSKNRKHGGAEGETYRMDSNSASKVSDQILNSTTAAASNSHKMHHYSEGARHHPGMSSPQGYHQHPQHPQQQQQQQQQLQQHQQHQHQQQQQQQLQQQQQQQSAQPTTFIPLLLDVNGRGSNQATAASQQQLFSRLQQQFLQQATIIRHPQMGELPVIQMTQAQLNQMVQQAAQHRQQNFHSEQPNQQQQIHPQQHPHHHGVSEGDSSPSNVSGFHTMAQMLAAQGLPTNTQMAFAIQVQDPSQPQQQPQQHQGRGGMPTYYDQQQQHHMQQQQPPHCQLPSLRNPNQMHLQPTNQMISPQHPSSSGQYQQMMSAQAPIKKMTLNSRGKSVPRNALQIEGDSGQSGMLEKIPQGQHPVTTTNHQHQISRNQQFSQHSQQQYPDSYNGGHNHPGFAPVNGRMGNSFFQSAHLQPINGRAHPDNNAQFQLTQTGSTSQPPLLAPLKDKSHRKSMQFGQSPDSAATQSQHRREPSQRDTSQQSRRHHPAIQHHYAKLSYNATGNAPNAVNPNVSGGSRSLATQSERGSGRSGNQGHAQGHPSSGHPSSGHPSSGHPSSQQQNVYVAYKGPLSDLIMTQQSNLNLPQHQRASGSGLRMGKTRQKSSSVTVNSTSRSGEPPETSSHQDMNGGIPYIFENQKINQAINQEELKVVKQHLEMAGQGCPSIIIGELKDLDQQGEFSTQPEPKTKKKGKTRKGGGFTSSQNQKMLSKSSVDAVRFGQRHVSQQPHQQMPVPNMQHIGQDQRMLVKDHKKKKGMMNQANMSSANQTLMQSHAESSYLDQQQQMMQFQEDTFAQMAVQHSVGQQSITPQNLKPNIQLKSQAKKGYDGPASASGMNQMGANAEGVQGSSEPTLQQHGIFAKTLVPACTKYYKSKNNSRMTPYKYKNGISNRLLVARETFSPKRAKMPVLVLNIDGVLGYFDEQKNYNCRERSIQTLQSLSHNYKIVGFSNESRGMISRFGRYLGEHKTPFAFDAVYQIQRKPVQNQNRVNLTQVILDFSGEDEEDLDLFVSSQIVLVTVAQNKLHEKFESMDLREVFDYDKEYLRGAKAPLIVRVPHARCRPMSSLAIETLFQLMTCLLVSSKLSNLETTSLFTYNDRTKGLSIPTSDKGIVSSLLPEKMRVVEKLIQTSKSLRFIMGEPPYGINLHKGFKQLTEVYRGANKPDWLDFNYRVFKPLLPIRMRLQKITQLALQGAQPPTGKKLIVRCETEDATRKYQVFCKKNEIIRKQIRKYRARYWAVNQIEDTNLEEENQDIVGDLLDDALLATTICDVVPEEANSAEPTPEKQPPSPEQNIITATGGPPETDDATSQQAVDSQTIAEGTDTVAPDQAASGDTAQAAEEEVKAPEAEKLGAGDCSSSSEDSDIDFYDEQAQAVKFKVIDIKHVAESEGGNLKKQMAVKAIETNKPVKIECRKIQKPKHQFVLDFFSKKQNSMMFTTNQAQHLQGAATLQIENQISELVQKLNEADKAGKKEVYNYDF